MIENNDRNDFTDGSVLFSDIRNFSNLSDLFPPVTLTKLLSEFHNEMSEIINKHGGILDKIIGDAVMVRFTSNGNNNADNAVLAGQEMLDRVAQKRYLGKFHVKIGVGIASGQMTLVSLANSSETVLGSTVNLAARLEAATKVFECPMLIDEETKNRLTFPVRSDFGLFPIPQYEIRGLYRLQNLYAIFKGKEDLAGAICEVLRDSSKCLGDEPLEKLMSLIPKFKSGNVPVKLATEVYLPLVRKNKDKAIMLFSAGDYDSFSSTQFNQGKRLMHEINMATPESFHPKNILDVGCGTGKFTRLLMARFPDANIVGIDISESMIEHCRKNFSDDNKSLLLLISMIYLTKSLASLMN